MLLPPAPVLAPLSAAYGALMRARLALYRRGFLHTQRVGVPVVSVGNITTGGTGKTPLVEWLARMSARDGRRVCILTRGYGRVDAGKRVVVSDGERLLAGAREGGDEPRLLAEMLEGTGVAVVSDANRVSAALWARENLQSEVFILDDGFQHLRIARDLDIVTLDGADAWGGRRLLPAGRLREPLRELSRADAIVITRADLVPDLDALRREAELLTRDGTPVFTSRLRTSRLRRLPSSLGDAAQTAGEFSAQEAVPQPLAAFCAVGNAGAFFEHLRRDGHALSHTRGFPDHHVYTQEDLDALAREATRSGARALATTAKDAVKLGALGIALPCYVVEVVLEFDEEERLLGIVREAIARQSVRSRENP